MENYLEELDKLNNLKEKGILTQEEFDKRKEEILGKQNNSSKTKGFAWSNLFISFFIALIGFLLSCALSAILIYHNTTDFPNDYMLYLIYMIIGLLLSCIAFKLESQKYKKTPSFIAIIIGFAIFSHPKCFLGSIGGFLASWVVLFDILQIKAGNKELKSSENAQNKSSAYNTKFFMLISILFIVLICGGFIGYKFLYKNNQYSKPPVKTIASSESNDKLDNDFNEAVRSRNLEKVKQLLSQGANINPKSKKCYLEESPLIVAIFDGVGDDADPNSTEIAKILINSGADVNIICGSKTGELNPLSIAIHDIQMTKLLIKAGADVNATLIENNGLKTTILVEALYYAKDSQVISELLNNGADYNVEYGGNKVIDLCSYVTNVKAPIGKYETLIPNCNVLLQFIKNKDTEKLQNMAPVILPDEFNNMYFKNTKSYEFQSLLQNGIEQYLVEYLKGEYSGNLSEYISEFSLPYIPLPEKPVSFNGNMVEFYYGTGEIAAMYLSTINFAIPVSKLRPFLAANQK